MMRDIHLGMQLPYHLGVRLPFETKSCRDDSEDILMRLLGVVCRVNLQYLHRNPSTPPLYESGVVYTPPDQVSQPPVDRAKLTKLIELLRAMGQDPETAMMIVRIIKGIEIFLDIPNLYNRRRGDCNELVPVRVAELWRAGVMASPYLTKAPNDRGGITYHAMVLHPDRTAEDPSLILGMGGTARAADRQEEIRRNFERWNTYMTAATRLIEAEGAPAALLGRKIDLMGLIPRDGVFRA